MAKQSINIGSSANDGQGDALRTAFDKVNDNFTDLYEGGTNNVNVVTIGKDTAVGGAITLTGSAVSQSGNTFTINTSAGQGNSGALQYNNGGAVAGANDILYTSGILKVTNTIEARGDGTNAGKLKLYCENTSSSHAITIEGPAHSGASSYNLKLPGAAPGNTQILQSNGSGQLSWINTPSGSGGSTLSISNDGSALSTNATSINFVGAGVTATGTGATKTVTIPGANLSGQDDKKFLYNNSGSIASSSLLSLGTDEVLIGDVAGDRGILRIEGSESNSAYIKLEGTTATRGVILTVQSAINSDYTITFPDGGPQDNNKILQSNSSGELSWIATPTGSTYSAASNGGLTLTGTAFSLSTGAALANLGGQSQSYTYLRRDGSWATPPNTTYAALANGGLTLYQNQFSLSTGAALANLGGGSGSTYLKKDGTSGTPSGSGSGTSYDLGFQALNMYDSKESVPASGSYQYVRQMIVPNDCTIDACQFFCTHTGSSSSVTVGLFRTANLKTPTGTCVLIGTNSSPSTGLNTINFQDEGDPDSYTFSAGDRIAVYVKISSGENVSLRLAGDTVLGDSSKYLGASATSLSTTPAKTDSINSSFLGNFESTNTKAAALTFYKSS
jgi:hypothetical protein